MLDNNPRETITQLFSFLRAQGNTDYLGERVSQLQHSLQCAHLATQSPQYGSDPEVILGALLHDVGRFIPSAKNMPAMIAPDGAYIGQASHEVLGERYLRQLGFSEKVCQLVGSHVVAKRFLTATEKGYYDGLSETSKRTLEFQGGVFSEEQVCEARGDPWLGEKLDVRRWDDRAKDPEMEVPGLEEYVELAVRCLDESRAHVVVVSRRYPLPETPVLIVSVSEGLLDQCLGHVQEVKRYGWIVEGFPRAETGNRPAVEQEVLEQLARRGVRVADLAAGAQDSSKNDTCLALDSDVVDIYNELEGLSATDPTGRAQVVVRRGLALLQQRKSDFVYLSLPTNLADTSFGNLLEELKDGLVGLDVVIAITADKAPDGRDSTGRTVFDAVFDRARKSTKASSVILP
ncbi:hypothetical protein P168DRAFT_300776 [Aspergillus campestris IBT 28561]|uniref:HD domain-containing protein n=1 Tax=Aspergillus campestris (strain IBT 28561) TaxID=1392248 RepID=A0A2I1DDN9_ASPC2|nr:uncharacterized protein P168DRAFT_300776 [Aspergillus campestris IBT 28561]PKY07998.1 hypothetical protein P168DRAFT_300776 [Aspergillus campestris IBT 28561]